MLEKRSNPKGKWCKAHPGTRPIKDFALPMILCNLSLEIEQLIDKQLIDQTIETCLHEVMEVFYQKDLGLIVENVSAEDNSLVDSFEDARSTRGIRLRRCGSSWTWASGSVVPN